MCLLSVKYVKSVGHVASAVDVVSAPPAVKAAPAVAVVEDLAAGDPVDRADRAAAIVARVGRAARWIPAVDIMSSRHNSSGG
jgi:hypothetical protein